jgi:predicted ribosomally synthesized peptide with SipW-like signal peptide
MNKLFIKFISLFVVIALNASGLLAIGETLAYFNDTETASGSTLSTGVLDMTVRSGQGNFVPGAENMMPGNQVNRDIYVGKTALSMPLNHNVGFEFVGGDLDLCEQLDLKIWYDHYHGPVSGGYTNRDMRLTYNGKLSALSNYTHTDFEIPHLDDQFDTDPNDGTEQWFYYSIILPSGIADSFQGKVCDFKFIYEAWQTNLSDSSLGFTDTEEISNTISTGTWIIGGNWTQTTVEDFGAGESSYHGSNEEIIVSSPGDAAIAVGEVIPPVFTASSGDGDVTHVSANAIDEDMNTYWKGTTGHDSWLMVDLGQAHDIGGVKIWFDDHHYPKGYKIQISDTGSFTGEEITVVHIASGNTNGYIEHSFNEVNGRYIRVYIIDVQGGNPWIYEFVTTKREIPAFDGMATLTSQSYQNGESNKWISLDWDETLDIGTDIQLSVQTSNNGSDWTPWLLKSGISAIDLSSLAQTRYIRWQAELSTNPLTDPILTPILHEVRVIYEQENIANSIVMNEFLPNPSGTTPDYGFDFGEDNNSMPQGEWVEIYNKGTRSVDLAEWYIEDSASNIVPIDLSHIMTGSTIIAPGNYLVVYMNAEILNNDAETIYLKDMFGNVVESYSYDLSNECTLEPTPDGTNNGGTSSGTCGVVPGNKSYARIPDGIGSWVDPIPTPAQPNKITVEEALVQEALVEEEILAEVINEHLEESLIFNMFTQGPVDTSKDTVIEEIMADPDNLDEIIPDVSITPASTDSEPITEVAATTTTITATTTIAATTATVIEVIEETEQPTGEQTEEIEESTLAEEDPLIEEVVSEEVIAGETTTDMELEPTIELEIITEAESIEEPVEQPIESVPASAPELAPESEEEATVIEEVVAALEKVETTINDQEEDDPEENE